MKLTDHFSLRGPKAAFPREICLHQCFEIMVEKQPQALAIIAEDRSITYQELDAEANHLVSYLNNLGTRPGTLIGVCMKRHPQVIAVLLAILKAGCTYVPLDPNHPVERLIDTLEDTHAPFVFIDPDFKELFSNSSARLVSPADIEFLHQERVGAALASSCTPESLAYVIYTSGSTGRPKGVRCHHQGVLNLLSDLQRRQPIGMSDICSWWTSLSFDVSVYEIFSPLVEGASLIIVPESIRADASLFMQWLYENKVTSCYIPPFMVEDFAVWVEDNPGRSSLRRLLVGVEPIPEKSLLALDAAVPSLHIINGYGPTETTICATLYSVHQDQPLHENTPIGKPVQNMAVHLLDQQGKPVAPGSPGELYIGGVGVAKGYLNRPKLNAERFLPDPYSHEIGASMYKTGDIVRLLEDGNLEFLGRVDFQIKFRGFRIEPGEIETALRKLREVREAAVIVHRDEERDILAAYVTLHPNKVLTRQKVREHLKRYLPNYMIPSAFVQVKHMPTTPNGKTDRDALPPPDPYNQLADEAHEHIEPQTDVQVTIASFFKEILPVNRVGLEDNFFELGGHSLLATQLISRIREAFAVEIPLSIVFKAPTIRLLAQELERLMGQSKQAQLPLLIAASDDSPALLSFSQMRVWYLDQLEPGSPAYNICLAYRLTGPLETLFLQKSFDEILRRHASLRTTFQKREGVAVQIIRQATTFSPKIVDLTHFPAAEREQEALRLCNADCHRGFDLSQGPLFRVLILRIGMEDHILMMTVHHIVSDGWSMGIIVRELMQLYSDYLTGSPPSLPPVEVQYADFARWQRSWMEGDFIKPQIQYWREVFETLPEPLELPTDRMRPAVMSYRGAIRSTILHSDLVREVRELTRREGVTLFMTLLSAFKVLLYRYTNQEDLCVGTFIANRNHLATENIVGFFINSLAMRTDISGDPSFQTLLHRVKDAVLGAYSHQDLPFEKLLEEVNPERDLSRTPIFQVMMVLQNMPLPPFNLKGLACQSVELDLFRSNFDLTLWFYETGPHLKAVMEYSTDLFDAETIAGMLQHFTELLRDAVHKPAKRISELSLLSQQEMETILTEWSGERYATIDFQDPVTRLFEEQADRHPHKVALVEFEEDTQSVKELTYADLNRRSNKFARYLMKNGCGPETAVAVVASRSIHFIVSILGVLKAGAAYVPIDPGYPEGRIDFIIKDTRTPLVITDSSHFDRLADICRGAELKLFRIDTDWPEVEAEDDANTANPAIIENLAYVIYTSGSTGQPKGVLIENRALSAFVHSAIEIYHLTAQDRVLQFASPSFDASIEEIFPTLAVGGTLLLRSDEMIRSMSIFLQRCEENCITVLDLPTAFWHQLVVAIEDGPIAVPECIRLVIIGGEQALADKVSYWQKKVRPEVRLFNTYGPTETTVVATAIEITTEPAVIHSDGRVPIGRPLPHLQTFVFDPHLQPVPAGVAGELYIGGAGLGRGYLNQPEKSADSFIANPLQDVSASRLYKTGDMARYLSDGNLEFLGRTDRQVKVRGFRVELAEIESALNRLPEVKESVVIAKELNQGPLQLLSYLVAAPDVQLDPIQLRTQLGNLLPDFMIPSCFTQVAEIPLNASGKIDIRSLPTADKSETADQIYIPPRNAIEEALIEIWQKVFGIDKIGIKDNFFDLGGHSLLSIQIIDQVNRAGLWLTPSQFIQNPTIQQLAQVITTARPAIGVEKWSCLVELQPHGSKAPLYFAHSTPGDVLGYMHLINHLGLDQPCYGFQSLGLKDMNRAHKRVEDMAAFYVAEMIKFQQESPYYMAGWCYGGILVTEMALQLRQMGKQVGGLILIETPYPRMQHGQFEYYLWRLVGLIRMGPEDILSYLRHRYRYWKKTSNREVQKLFSLHLAHGPLANREQVYRLNQKAIDAYKMAQHPACPIRIFNGDQLEEGHTLDPQGLWVKHSDNIETYQFPGNHLTILKEPGVTPLAKQLNDCLDRLHEANS